MAAVSLSVRDPDSATASAVRGFLQCAVALYQDVLALHGDGDGDDSIMGDAHSSPDQRLGAHTALIRDSLSALNSVQLVAAGVDAPHPLSTLPGACSKVGQDLMLHLDKTATDDHESQTQFGDIWSIRDIATLGARLQELSQRFHDDVDSTFQ